MCSKTDIPVRELLTIRYGRAPGRFRMQVLGRASSRNESSGTVDWVKPRDIDTREVEDMMGALAGQVCEHKSGFAVVAETWQFAGIAALGTL